MADKQSYAIMFSVAAHSEKNDENKNGMTIKKYRYGLSLKMGTSNYERPTQYCTEEKINQQKKCGK